MTSSWMSGLLQRGVLVAAMAALAPAVAPSPVLAQSEQPAYQPPYGDGAAPRRGRVKRDDAFKPADDGAGLGTLQSSGAEAAPYPPPSNVAQGYGSPASVPPPYGASPPPYGSSDYGSTPPSRPYPPAGAAASDGYRPQPYGASANDAYRPPAGGRYEPGPGPAPGQAPAYGAPPAGGYAAPGGGFGQPYSPPGDGAEPRGDNYGGRRPYMSGDDNGRPPYRDERADSTYSSSEILSAGHGFFGSLSQGLASVIEYAFQRQGRPNGYILGEDAGGAFVAGLRYGEGRLHTKDAGTHKVYWQGPSLGYDAGAAGSKVMVLVYNLRDPSDIYERFGGVDGSAYVIGGISLNFQKRDNIVLAPIRAGVGLRLGANIGYLKYTRNPTWNPF